VPLHLDYRPQTLDDIVGNESTVAELRAMLGRKKGIAHAYLFTGPKGCGKTTLARIVGASLGAKGVDFHELNTADFRGVETAREIRAQVKLKPIFCKNKVYLLDECFAEHTEVNTRDGVISISKVEPGQCVSSIRGEDARVMSVFRNNVILERVVKVRFSNGRVLFTTKEHMFLTQTGWIEAQNLVKNNALLPCVICNTMQANNLQTGEVSNDSTTKNNQVMPNMRDEIQAEKTDPKDVFEEVCKGTKRQRPRSGANGDVSVYGMREKSNKKEMSSRQTTSQTKVLQSALCGEMENESPVNSGKDVHEETCTKAITSITEICDDKKGQRTRKKIFQKNVKGKSDVRPENGRKDEVNEEDEWYTERVLWRTGRERKDNRASKSTVDGSRLAYGSGHISGNKEKGVPDLLQSGHRVKEGFNCHRSRRENAQDEKDYIERCEKDESFEQVRVESVEIYQRGNNDRSFASVIGDNERSRGFVTFYDLEIEGHPSYFANGFLVHNCHKLTGDAQEALLKLLEDTPRHTFFVLATTNPGKLRPTLKRRCSPYVVKPVNEETIVKHLRSIAKKYGKDVPKSIREQIAETSEGSLGVALMLMDKIIDLPKNDMKQAVKFAEEEQSGAHELFILLIKKRPWRLVADKIKQLLEEHEPESIRRIVLACCNTAMLKGNGRAYKIAVAFSEPYYDSGKTGLTLSCFEIVNSK